MDTGSERTQERTTNVRKGLDILMPKAHTSVMATTQTPKPGEYYAAKIKEGCWGIFYINAINESRQFGIRTYTTKRQARQVAAGHNWAEREIARQEGRTP